jgi:acyl carrier protein
MTQSAAPTAAEIRATVLRILGGIAPEVDVQALDPQVEIRDQVDLDSMDFLGFVVGLHEALGVDIPEGDYPHLATLDGCVHYLATRRVAGLPGAAASTPPGS